MSAPATRSEEELVAPLPGSEPGRQHAEGSGSALLGCGSLSMAGIEAICTFFVVLSKFGILVAFTSFLSTVIVSRYHVDRVRVPVLAAAFVGACLNLLAVSNRRRLRKLRSAAWRTRTPTPRQRLRSALLVVAGVITIGLIVAEFWIHPVRGL